VTAADLPHPPTDEDRNTLLVEAEHGDGVDGIVARFLLAHEARLTAALREVAEGFARVFQVLLGEDEQMTTLVVSIDRLSALASGDQPTSAEPWVCPGCGDTCADEETRAEHADCPVPAEPVGEPEPERRPCKQCRYLGFLCPVHGTGPAPSDVPADPDLDALRDALAEAREHPHPEGTDGGENLTSTPVQPIPIRPASDVPADPPAADQCDGGCGNVWCTAAPPDGPVAEGEPEREESAECPDCGGVLGGVHCSRVCSPAYPPPPRREGDSATDRLDDATIALAARGALTTESDVRSLAREVQDHRPLRAEIKRIIAKYDAIVARFEARVDEDDLEASGRATALAYAAIDLTMALNGTLPPPAAASSTEPAGRSEEDANGEAPDPEHEITVLHSELENGVVLWPWMCSCGMSDRNASTWLIARMTGQLHGTGAERDDARADLADLVEEHAAAEGLIERQRGTIDSLGAEVERLRAGVKDEMTRRNEASAEARRFRAGIEDVVSATEGCQTPSTLIVANRLRALLTQPPIPSGDGEPSGESAADA
jgi:hypothetical protein